MEIDVIKKHDNKLLERVEVDFVVKHPKESTPQRKAISETLREILALKKEILIVGSFSSEFGKGESKGNAKVYKTLEKAKAVEEDYMLKRNGLKTEEEKK